jgi:hypothetical protein
MGPTDGQEFCEHHQSGGIAISFLDIAAELPEAMEQVATNRAACEVVEIVPGFRQLAASVVRLTDESLSCWVGKRCSPQIKGIQRITQIF